MFAPVKDEHMRGSVAQAQGVDRLAASLANHSVVLVDDAQKFIVHGLATGLIRGWAYHSSNGLADECHCEQEQDLGIG